MAIDVLRQILGANWAVDDDWHAYDPHSLRYVLEYDAGGEAPDRAVETARLAALLQSPSFELLALNAEQLPNFLLLVFPGIERVLPDDQLFEIGYDIADALGLASCEPDLGTPYYTDPEKPDPALAESTRIVGALCLADPPAPADVRWALASARIDRAWRHSQGRGIIIAQPDTGVSPHDELPAEHLGLDLAIDILTGRRDPTDPLYAGMANPGHGTATGSVAAGRTAKRLAGAAPEATLVPIRCIDDVKIFNAAPVAAAIAHAIDIGAHVISMSLGGIPSRAIHAAIQRAVAADMIVVAAAGNCVGTVVWPARYDDVIAVGGTNAADKPWKGSSRGDAVDISAPAEFVWVARREAASDTDLARIEAGQGTSFATALTAGCAALWLAHHGRGAVLAEARRRGLLVQHLFRAALAASARTPAGWRSDRFGAGIVDAERLLALGLDAIPGRGGGEAGGPSDRSGAEAFLIEEAGTPHMPAARFLPEIANIALRQRQNGATLADLTIEAKLPGTVASAALMSAVREIGDARLSGLLSGPGVTGLAPPPFAADAIAVTPALVLKQKGSVLEAAGGAVSVEAMRAYLSANGRAEQLRHVEEMIGRAGDIEPEFAAVLFGRIISAFDVLEGKAQLTVKAQTGLEALVLLHGRPALRVSDNRIDFEDPLLGDWHDKLFPYFLDDRLADKLASVGRIDADDIHWGTGFVVGDGLVLTNRHVLQEIGAPVPRRDRPEQWMLTKPNPMIDFADDPSSETAASKFRITEVVGSGDHNIDPYLLDFAKLDAALLRVEPVNAAGKTLPSPISLVRTATSSDLKREVLTIGYPAAPASLPRRDNAVDMEIVERLHQIFGAQYGRKYLAPGTITKREGAVFFHDATTLAGCSGSAVLRTDRSFDAVGLHFAGQWRSANYAQNLPALQAAAPLLATAGVRWTD